MDIWLIINHKAVAITDQFMVFGNRAKAIAYAQGLGFKGEWSEQVGFAATWERQNVHVTIVRLEAR